MANFAIKQEAISSTRVFSSTQRFGDGNLAKLAAAPRYSHLAAHSERAQAAGSRIGSLKDVCWKMHSIPDVTRERWQENKRFFFPNLTETWEGRGKKKQTKLTFT